MWYFHQIRRFFIIRIISQMEIKYFAYKFTSSG